MNYENSSSKFHSFSGDGISYGLSFPDVNDAQHFFTSVTTFCPRPLPRSLSFNRAKFGNKGTKLVNAFKKHKSVRVILLITCLIIFLVIFYGQNFMFEISYLFRFQDRCRIS